MWLLNDLRDKYGVVWGSVGYVHVQGGGGFIFVCPLFCKGICFFISNNIHVRMDFVDGDFMCSPMYLVYNCNSDSTYGFCCCEDGCLMWLLTRSMLLWLSVKM